MRLLPREEYDGEENGEEQSSQADDAPGNANLSCRQCY